MTSRSSSTTTHVLLAAAATLAGVELNRRSRQREREAQLRLSQVQNERENSAQDVPLTPLQQVAPTSSAPSTASTLDVGMIPLVVASIVASVVYFLALAVVPVAGAWALALVALAVSLVGCAKFLDVDETEHRSRTASAAGASQTT